MHCHIYIYIHTRHHMYTMDTWGYSIIFLLELGCTRYRYYPITSWDAALRRGRPRGRRCSTTTRLAQMCSCWFIQWIGLREILQESPIFNGKSMVSCRFSLEIH